jgi:hypothetical protein
MQGAITVTSRIRVEGRSFGAYHRRMARCRRGRGWAGGGTWFLLPLLGLAVACGGSGWTDVSPDTTGGGGRGGSVATGGAGGLPGGGTTGQGGVGGSGGVAAGGSAGEAGGSGGGGGIDAQPPPEDGPVVQPPEEDTGGPPPPPPVDAMVNDGSAPGDGTSMPNLSAGLVGRWKLDEGTGTMASDSSGNGNDGVIKGAAWAAGSFPGAKYANPGALRFTNDDSVQLGVKALPANNKPQTVAFWLNYTAVPSADGAVCVALTDGKGGGSRLKLGFKNQRLAAVKGGGTTNLVNAAPPAPGWHHFAYTFDGSVHRLFVDGQQKAMSTATPDNGAVANARLGGNFDSSEGFTGFLDEIRIYDHPLAAAEIAALAAGEQ